MSTYEKIASVLLGFLVLIMLVFSFREWKEPPEHNDGSEEQSDFDKSFGQNFTIGRFTNVVSEQFSPEEEEYCKSEQLVIVSVLHDIKEHLETKGNEILHGQEQNAFEVNDHTLQILCHKTAKIVLSDSDGRKLILQKVPFTRAVPEGDDGSDIGTDVHINATIVLPGETEPEEPTISGNTLIPDRYLEFVTSSPLQ